MWNFIENHLSSMSHAKYSGLGGVLATGLPDISGGFIYTIFFS
jgi:hypothetical protein